MADLSGFGITDYSNLAADRNVEVVLNAPLSATGTVPSDNPQVWIPYTTDGYEDPYLAEGTRLMWWLRKESATPPYYVCRGGTLCALIEDEAQQDDARTRFTGWDPWHYLLSRPVCDADGVLPGVDGLSYTATQVSVIIAQQLRNTINNHGFAYVDAGDGMRSGEGAQYQDYGGSAEYAGTLETGAGMSIDINFAQGTSVGQAWKQLTNMGVCDIVLDPIYVPAGRTVGGMPVYNFLVELNVYAQAGVLRPEQVFAWNLPGRSLVELTRQQDGSARANNVFFRAGQGGSAGDAPLQTDVDSEAKYGEYWAQQFFPGVTGLGAVTAVTYLAAEQLLLRARGRQTVTFKTAPERAPRPWQDYQIGDRFPVWASPQGFRQLLTGDLV